MPNLPLTPLPPHSSPVPFRTPSVLIAPRVGVYYRLPPHSHVHIACLPGTGSVGHPHAASLQHSRLGPYDPGPENLLLLAV